MATDLKVRAHLSREKPKGGAPRRNPTKAATAELAVVSEQTDLLAVVGGFSDAISVVTVVQHALAGKEIAGIGNEEVALRHALTLLRSAYTALDLAAGRW